MGFAPRVSIDHAALRHNLALVKRHAPASRIWAVIKANAYGHGQEAVARTLNEADGFALARIGEALRLRHIGIDKPLLILAGVFTLEDLERAVQWDCQLVVHQPEQVALLEQLSAPARLRVWLKVDTGMHRLGFPPEQVPEMVKRLRVCPVVGELNLMSHFACADDLKDATTQAQCSVFEQLPKDGIANLSIANSAGLLAHPQTRLDWVRPGIMLYGISPFLQRHGEEDGLLPVMTFSARIIAVHRCRQGDRIGYSGRFTCPEEMPVAVIGAGYGDGYPRHAPNGTPVLVRGQRLPLVGRVSMDTICVDARALPDLRVGESVVLWGKGLPVEEIAQAAGTIGYELVCGITGRVEFAHQGMTEG